MPDFKKMLKTFDFFVKKPAFKKTRLFTYEGLYCVFNRKSIGRLLGSQLGKNIYARFCGMEIFWINKFIWANHFRNYLFDLLPSFPDDNHVIYQLLIVYDEVETVFAVSRYWGIIFAVSRFLGSFFAVLRFQPPLYPSP